nr:uncharacterized protein LOC128696310 [Cherax quadricarinatus]
MHLVDVLSRIISYRSLRKNGRGEGLWELELPPPPPTWLAAELARLFPPHQPYLQLPHLDWSHNPSSSQNNIQTELNSHRALLSRYGKNEACNESGSKNLLSGQNLKKLGQLYDTLLDDMEKKAVNLPESKMLYRTSTEFNENNLMVTDVTISFPVGNIHEDLTTASQPDSKISTLESYPVHGSRSTVRKDEALEHQSDDSLKMGKFCGFCKRNGEMPTTYYSHSLRDSSGHLTCDALRNYTCPRCGGTGNNAHTISYCPMTTIKVSSLATKLKMTKRNAASVRSSPSP